MKKQVVIISFFLLFFHNNLNADVENNLITSKTFFCIQPIFRPTSPETVSINRDQLKIYNDKKTIIDLTLYGGQSCDDEKLGKYFLPFGKSKILVGELGSTAVKEENVDAIANYFNILTAAKPDVGDNVSAFNKYTFQSEVSFRPKHSFVGAVFSYKQHISRYTDKGIWFELVVPLEHVRNVVHLHEKIIKKGGPNGNDPAVPNGYVANMTAAFKQKNWRFGKIDGPQCKTGIADPYLRFGYVYTREETHHLNSYFGFSAPTGTIPTGEFVFEPIVGNCGHATLFFGTSAGFRIWSKCEKTLNFEFDFLGTMFASNEQTRSFDLKDKSWSRYMWVFLDNKSVETHPGINTFTKRVRVSPGTSRDLNSALIYKDSCFQAEAGYHFYSRQSEDVQLACNWKRGPAIATILNNNNEVIAGKLSRDNATINEYLRIRNDSINNEETYKPIQQSDLDLNSAAHPSLICHTGYLALSYNWDCSERPKFFGIGGSYEFSSDNAALSRWMLWARFGISF